MKTISFIPILVVTTFLLGYSPDNHLRPNNEKAILKSFAKPDEVREFPLGKLELIKINGAMIGRATFQPGWKWSTSVQPIAKTKSCEAPHFQYHVSGVLKVQMDDGTILE